VALSALQGGAGETCHAAGLARSDQVWTPVCGGDALGFFGPLAAEMAAAGQEAELIARFWRVAAP